MMSGKDVEGNNLGQFQNTILLLTGGTLEKHEKYTFSTHTSVFHTCSVII
jgi:hypothetical protein